MQLTAVSLECICRVHSVTIEFLNRGHKIHTKKIKIYINTITQYSPLTFRHNICTADVRNQNARENVLSDIVCSSLITVCWIDETALNRILFIAIFILEILQKKSPSTK
jgi:hypothetical protein